MLPKENIKSIAIFRALQLGDVLCSIPACRALRHAFPEAHIAIIGLPWMKMLPERFPAYFDEFILFPGYPGLPEQPFNAEQTTTFLLKMAQRKFDLVLQMQGNGTIVNPMIELFGAAFSGGFFIRNDYRPDSPFFMEYPDGIAEVHRHLRLMKHLGIESDNDDLEFPVTGKDELDLKNSFELPSERYVCVHAGSRGEYRRWPTTHFAKAADRCFENGYNIVLTGTAEEMPIVERVASEMKSSPLIAAGKTNLGAMAALLGHSNGLISNCTGVSHVASALKVKSVIISMDGEPERWAPVNKQLHKTIDWTKVPDFEVVMKAVDSQFASAS
jgi:ADP-heptose:LPS heptosyltransferase